MKKSLAIKLVQYDYAIAMQVQNQVGDFSSTKHVKFSAQPGLYDYYICLRGTNKDANQTVCVKTFNTESQKSKYYEQVLQWISYELFTLPKIPTVGYPCRVSDNLKIPTANWTYAKELLCILPKKYHRRFVVTIPDDMVETRNFAYAKAIPQIRPEQFGDVFAWELEVSKGDK